MDTSKSFLGTGWQFPPEFEPVTGSAILVSNEEDIRESLNVLLSTSLGERVMQPRYGCNLEDYLFEPLNSTTVGFLKNLVTNAILFYEPRIQAEEIDVTGDDSVALIEGRFTISVIYTIPGTNSRFNFVYDYYKNESLNNG